jgi:hypothetical protein
MSRGGGPRPYYGIRITPRGLHPYAGLRYGPASFGLSGRPRVYVHPHGTSGLGILLLLVALWFLFAR